ncbi:uncharacterized protein F4807DRAFT_465679 [Annulohypoxylon truncatum]|uniref:uncharacterized protein n=1 Tax=Annulohypoxylon truncatum TaxID=327061 RepID=UPI002008D03C|nr:uncharacterized protein F4807DRAFT_465679 [Annulohypoxylon truncatum]KAI1204444.1 hypothetical protein F4807DRAFT_465679 [Annulohypoxylon truncatum]
MAKQRPCVGYISEEEYECDSYMSYESPCTRDSPDCPRETNQELLDEPIEEPTEEPVEEPVEKTILELISEKTGLNRYTESHLAYTPIRSEVVYDLLSRSLRLAQEIFYDGCRIYFPDIYYREYDGPHEVRFGWKEMQDSFFRGDFTDRIIAGKRYQRSALEYYINNMTWIRNQVCHFQSCTSVCQVDTLDKAIRDVQELAAVFGDEAKALQARALRDELHQGAKRELSELETMWLLAELPGARPWQRYQLHSLWKVPDSHPKGEVITRICQELKEKHRSIDRPYWPSAYLEAYRDILDSWTEHL